MLSRLREHLGGAGLIVAVVALVAALAGGAIAANGGSGDGKATASAKAKKGPRGPKGPKGDTGPQGPAGPAGPQGAKGDTGAAGSNGSNGSDGAKGATGAAGTAGAKGATGATGATGFSGFTETLPPGKTETGSWALQPLNGEGVIGISFPIPLAAPPANENVEIVPVGGKPAECDNGTGEDPSAANPEADPGHFCVFTGGSEPAGTAEVSAVLNPGTGSGGAAKTGAMLYLVSSGPAGIWGTFAVTAPLAP